MLSVVLLSCLLGSALSASGSFSYDQQGNWDEDMCQTGNKQSPINVNTIDYTRYYTATFPDLGTQSISFDENVTMTLKMDVDDKPIINMPGTWPVGHTKGLQLLQLHFHWGASSATGSEHKFFGTQYAGEVHLVMRNLDNDVGGSTNSYAVFGVFLEERSTGTGTMDSTLSAMIDNPDSVDSMDLSGLWSTDTTEIYTYEGSLTTPDCSEMVFWQVFKEPLSVGPTTMAKFRAYEGIGKTYRDVQPLNSRTITHRILGSEFNDDRSEGDAETETIEISDEVPDPMADKCLYDTDITAYRCYYEKSGAVTVLSSVLVTVAATLLTVL